MRVLVTGANGFVGSALTQALRAGGTSVTAAVRKAAPDCVAVGEIDGSTDWRLALDGCEAVVHTAARVHQMNETEIEAATRYRETNIEGTINLARQAAKHGLKRFIFLSSIKAMGEAGGFESGDVCAPEDAYGRSKLEAEKGLEAIAAETGLEVVILRLPLVYGPGVKGNFLTLFKAVEKGYLLPLGVVKNARSLLFLGNLNDLITLCLTHPAAAGKVWLPSDGEAVSTPKLIREIGSALGKTPRLLPVPLFLMRFAAAVFGKQAAAERVFGSLTVNSEPLWQELGWAPRFTQEQGLEEIARWRSSGHS